MNAKILFKTVFLIVMLLVLVMIGLYNKQLVSFALPPVINKAVQLPAALMYFVFFAVGVITGTVLSAGGKRGSSGGAKSGKGDR
jgi:uncharacterized membrane protein YciS (DUF1049 family)